MSFGQSFGAFAQNFASARMDQRDRAERKESAARQDRWLDIMEKQGAGGGMPALGAVPDAVGAIPGVGAAVRGSGQEPVQSLNRPTGNDADYLRSGLLKRGMSPHVADGWLMNFRDESGLDPSALGDNGNAFGLAQWNGPRMRSLKAFATDRGGDASDRDIQMDYLMHELNGSEAGAWKKIQAAKTPGAAAAAILNHFERPAEVHRARREKSYLAFDSRPPTLGAIR